MALFLDMESQILGRRVNSLGHSLKMLLVHIIFSRLHMGALFFRPPLLTIY